MWSKWLKFLLFDFLCNFSSVAQSCLTLCDPMDCSTPGFPPIANSQSLLKLMCIESVMPSNHFILCCLLLLLPSIFPSIGVTSWHQVAKVLEFQVQHQFFPWIFRVDFLEDDWFDFLAVQGTLQHHSSKASVLQRSAFFTVQLSSIHDHWKTHSLD